MKTLFEAIDACPADVFLSWCALTAGTFIILERVISWVRLCDTAADHVQDTQEGIKADK